METIRTRSFARADSVSVNATPKFENANDTVLPKYPSDGFPRNPARAKLLVLTVSTICLQCCEVSVGIADVLPLAGINVGIGVALG